MFDLLTRYNSYVGREYASALISAGVQFSMITFGDGPDRDEFEEGRCGGYWKPAAMNKLAKVVTVYRYSSTNDPEFFRYLAGRHSMYGIQGGIEAIVGKEIIDEYPHGIVNFHPGDLPMYRGCMAPEWQIYDRKPVVCTAHLIDTGIDTGDIVEKRNLDLDYESYNQMRASVYPSIAVFVGELSAAVSKGARLEGLCQGPGIYRKPMTNKEFETMRKIGWDNKEF